MVQPWLVRFCNALLALLNLFEISGLTNRLHSMVRQLLQVGHDYIFVAMLLV